MCIYNHIQNWIQSIGTPTKKLDGHSVCPYAKKAEWDLVICKEDVLANCFTFVSNKHLKKEVTVFIFDDDFSKFQLKYLCELLNSEFSKYVFYPDHRKRKTYVGEAISNNGKYNVVLAQRRKELEKARTKLKETNYYSFWNKKYLKEILNA
tara:strand:- start:6155 stop:6607 length:453 start_codon:yes stop_codon:yes gene_type:complete